MKKIAYIQFVVLLCGVLFAWTNFAIELSNWLQTKACTTCSFKNPNPFLTPCFFGALFFTVSFMLSALLVRRLKNIPAA